MNMHVKVKEPVVSMNLDERALLVKLSIGAWSARKTDREVTMEVAESHKATSDSGYFRKQLFGKEALNQIIKIAGAARASHYTLTLPWNDDGARIITTESYQEYTKVMKVHRRNFQDAVDEFIENYDKYVKESKQRLGTMFKTEDYPAKELVRGKFTFDVEPAPLPNSRDFRAKVSDAETKAIIRDIERRTKDRLDAAMRDVWERVADVTGKMADKLANYKPKEGIRAPEGIFKDSLVENVRKLAETLPLLNVTNDPKMESLQKELLDQLCAYEADDLRGDAKARAVTAKKAKQIFDKVSRYMA